jgi:hypothetical protein
MKFQKLLDGEIVSYPNKNMTIYKKGVNVSGRRKIDNIEKKSSKPKSNKKQVKRSQQTDSA